LLDEKFLLYSNAGLSHARLHCNAPKTGPNVAYDGRPSKKINCANMTEKSRKTSIYVLLVKGAKTERHVLQNLPLKPGVVVAQLEQKMPEHELQCRLASIRPNRFMHCMQPGEKLSGRKNSVPGGVQRNTLPNESPE